MSKICVSVINTVATMQSAGTLLDSKVLHLASDYSNTGMRTWFNSFSVTLGNPVNIHKVTKLIPLYVSFPNLFANVTCQ